MPPVSIQDVIDEAVTDKYVDDGGTTDQINPSVQARALNVALNEVWLKAAELNLDMYAFRDKTLAVVSGTSEYALDTDVERVTSMNIQEGTAPDYIYTEITPLEESRDSHRFQGVSRLGPPFSASRIAPFKWFQSKQALDGTGNFVRYIKFVGPPGQNYTVLYDGLRNIKTVSVPAAGATWDSISVGYTTATWLDIPSSFKRAIVLEMVKYFNMKNKSKWDDINQELTAAYRAAVNFHRRGIQWQGTLQVVREG